MYRTLVALPFLLLAGCSSAANAPYLPTASSAAIATVVTAAATPVPIATATPTATATPSPTAVALTVAIVGAWVPASPSNINGPYLGIKRIVFYTDGTTVVDDVFAANQPGRYAIAGSLLKLTSASGKAAEYTASFDGDTLVLNDGLVSARFLRRGR